MTTDTTWDLTDLYADDVAFDAALAEAEAVVERLGAFEGRLGEGPEALGEACAARWGARQQVMRLLTYGVGHRNVDLPNDHRQQQAARAIGLEERLQAAEAWFDPEVAGLADVVSPWLERPELAPYRYPLSAMLRRGPHLLDPAQERQLAWMAPTRSAPREAFMSLRASELPYRSIDLDGQTVRVDSTTVRKLKRHPDRSVRDASLRAFHGSLGAVEKTVGHLLVGSLSGYAAEARARGYDGARHMALSEHFIPVAAYDQLLAQIDASRGVLHRACRVRARLLGIERMGYHDLSAPVARLERSFSLDEAATLAVASAAPLGDAYVDDLARGLRAGWVHALPDPGRKVPGAYMMGTAYRVHPYVLLNHTDDWMSVHTFVHELGHAMHTRLADAAQPFPTSRYTTLTAEVASIFNEVLLVEHVLSNTTDREARLFHLTSDLDMLQAIYFRQALFGGVEKQLYDELEAHRPLTGPRIGAIYLEQLRRMYGHEEGAVAIDEAHKMEWAAVFHFHLGFYVWQYATSLAAAACFHQQLVVEGDPARQRYLSMLAAGGSAPPHELLCAAGVDLTTPAPYQAVEALFVRRLEQLEELLG